MTRIALFVVVCLLTISGAIATRAGDRDEQNQSVTLYTSRGLGDKFTCSAVNVSDKTLDMTFAVRDNNGKVLSCASPTTCFNASLNATTNPTPEFSVPSGTVAELNVVSQSGSIKDGYCSVAVSETDNRDDVRVNLLAGLTGIIPGTTTPFFVSRVFEGH
ncbi:MAG: hypothetical protein JO213_22685 [Alphaproteobacteria bacterium]|nr:hypothetical protein [Alphaproteobacteria bacterium]